MKTYIFTKEYRRSRNYEMLFAIFTELKTISLYM